MKTTSDRYSTADEGNPLWGLLRGTAGLIWFVVRVPIGIVLAFLEPFVRLVLFGIAVAGVIAAFVYKGSGVAPPIPFMPRPNGWWRAEKQHACLIQSNGRNDPKRSVD